MVRGEPHVCWTPRPVLSFISCGVLTVRFCSWVSSQAEAGSPGSFKKYGCPGPNPDRFNKKPWGWSLGICIFKKHLPGWFSRAAVLRATDLSAPGGEVPVPSRPRAHLWVEGRGRLTEARLFRFSTYTERGHWLLGCLGSCQPWACLLWPWPWNRRLESLHR